jgi:hypothetical protein
MNRAPSVAYDGAAPWLAPGSALAPVLGAALAAVLGAADDAPPELQAARKAAEAVRPPAARKPRRLT